MTALPKLPPRRPQSERRHYVFLNRCDCPIGLVEEGEWCQDEIDAWTSMYDAAAERRAARDRGVHVRYVDHATYVREFYPLMTKPCPHGGA